MNTCTVLRRKLIKSGTLSRVLDHGIYDRVEWRNEACGTPLFSNEERKTGHCRSCASGWRTEHNYPIESEPHTLPDREVRTPRGKRISHARYLALTHAAQARDRALSCEHGHFGCAAWQGGPCEAETAARIES